LSDEELLDFVKTGRPPYDPASVTFVDMPARGGNPAFTDDDLLDVIAYVRSLSGGAAPANAEDAAPTAVEETSNDATDDEDSFDLVGDLETGQTLFVTCAECHGEDARGDVGKDLTASEFVQSLSDQDLLDFIKIGRPSWDEANTTGEDMPARGGDFSLTDQNIVDIIAYIRSLAE